MKEFILAALPWVLCGIAVAIICANLAGSKQKTQKKLDRRIALGLALGLMFGSALNAAGLWGSHGLGLALGPLWGMALASLLPDRGEDKGSSDDNSTGGAT